MPGRSPAAGREGYNGATVWAVIGVALILSHAAGRLTLRGFPVLGGLRPAEWFALLAITGGFVYVEGVRALQGRFVPFVLQRARMVKAEPRLTVRVLAPLYAMSLIGARARSMLRAWAGITAIILAVIIVRWFPQPWRGITDLAVAAALVWGVVCLCVAALRAGGPLRR